MSDIDLDKVAENFQDVLAAVQDGDASTQTLVICEGRLQTVWAEVNDNVDSLEDMEAIYPDE